MSAEATKVCRLCGVEKPLSDFYEAKGTRDGRRGECKACNLAGRKGWYEGNREREIARVKAWNQANRQRRLQYEREYRASGRKKLSDRSGHLRRKFGMTLADYERLLREQGGVCAICGDPAPEGVAFHVDHDHATGAVRGLLCVRCNNGLGQFREDPVLVAEAGRYLERAELARLHRFAQRRVDALKPRARA